MKKHLVAFIFSLLSGFIIATPLSSHAGLQVPEGEKAFGLLVGEPIAATGKFWFDLDTAIDGQLGYSFANFFVIYGDYLWHFRADFLGDSQFVRELIPYIGVGAGFRFSTQDEIARKRDDNSAVEFFMRIPVGMEWKPADPPVGVFAELAPGFKLIPKAGFIFQAGVGVRYYF